jgi:uncharacterized membrane protein YjjP (DUF1212 family)
VSTEQTPQLVVDYLVELGTALMSSGCPTHRLEDLLVRLAKEEGFEADAFAVPTGLFVSVRTPEGHASVVSMVRVKEWSTDLRRLVELDEILNEVASKVLSIPQAREKISALSNAKTTWPLSIQLLASIGISAGSAISLGGSLTDAALSAFGGFILRCLMLFTRQQPDMRLLDNFLGGFVAGLLAWLSSIFILGTSREAMVLSIVLPLLPGLTLTTGLDELTHRNLVAGTARLMQAAITLLSLVFGIALALGVEKAYGIFPVLLPRSNEISGLIHLVALALASASSGVLLGVPKKFMGVVVVCGAIVWSSTQLTRSLEGTYAAFISAFVLALISNAWARSTERPAQLVLLPGMLLLVPGALSFRSLELLLRGDVVTSAAQISEVAFIAGALVMGLLVANVLLPARKYL